MIVSAYILPHSPILIPSIGRKNLDILKKTAKSFDIVKKELIEKKIDTVLVISPHKKNNLDISINNDFDFKVNFEEFGDYSSKLRLDGDMTLAYNIKEGAEPDFWPKLEAINEADHGVNIPLYLLLSEKNQRLKNFRGKASVINTSLSHNLKYHFDFGAKIYQELEKSKKRIAVVASGELSHCLSRRSPGGFFQKAKMFDDKTIESLKKGDDGVENFLLTDQKLALDSKECGLRPIALMLGIISALNYQPKTLSYQSDFGIGYLAMDMGL